MTDRKNPYDKNDIIRREAVMVAGPLKIGAYRVRDLDTGEFGPMQIHMTYDNMVMAVLGESSARLLATFVDRHLPKHPEILLTANATESTSPDQS